MPATLVDPLEVMVQWLKSSLPSVSGRVANQHQFGGAWVLGQKCVSIHPENINQELYARVYEANIEVRLYGASLADLVALTQEITELCSTNRHTVTITGGKALIHFCNIASGLSSVYDDDLGMEVGVLYLFSMIAKEAI